jgi:hypothetical protein
MFVLDDRETTQVIGGYDWLRKGWGEREKEKGEFENFFLVYS